VKVSDVEHRSTVGGPGYPMFAYETIDERDVSILGLERSEQDCFAHRVNGDNAQHIAFEVVGGDKRALLWRDQHLHGADLLAEHVICQSECLFGGDVGPRFCRGGGETLAFLPEVNEKLREAAAEKGCDAVIWIDYDFDRDPNVQILTGYGTGVKIKR
jgi:hypothetical protein